MIITNFAPELPQLVISDQCKMSYILITGLGLLRYEISMGHGRRSSHMIFFHLIRPGKMSITFSNDMYVFAITGTHSYLQIVGPLTLVLSGLTP